MRPRVALERGRCALFLQTLSRRMLVSMSLCAPASGPMSVRYSQFHPERGAVDIFSKPTLFTHQPDVRGMFLEG